CCKNVRSSKDTVVRGLLAQLGVNLNGADIPIGTTCSPSQIIGIGGTSCSGQTVCCENTKFDGVVALGCVPINITL
ncbi:hypothetical protein L218DRAFT_882885, partial [Marasmius fiardii PR-910]